jgi:hypothetical protein
VAFSRSPDRAFHFWVAWIILVLFAKMACISKESGANITSDNCTLFDPPTSYLGRLSI